MSFFKAYLIIIRYLRFNNLALIILLLFGIRFAYLNVIKTRTYEYDASNDHPDEWD